jgi:hypothetical protein
MTDKLEFLGRWFLPSNPEDKVSGRLVFLPNEGITLELIGCFKEQDNILLSCHGVESWIQVIQGEGYEGYSFGDKYKKVTLLNCWVFAVNACASAFFPITKYSCRYMVVGTLLSSVGDLRFNSIQIGFTELNCWLPPRMIEPSVQSCEGEPANGTLSVSANTLITPVKVDGNIRVSLVSENDCVDGTIRSPRTLCEIAYIKEKGALSYLFDKAELFKQFLSLSTFSVITYSDISLYDHDNDEPPLDGQIRLYYAESVISTQRKRKIGEFLFSYIQIESLFSEIIKNWYVQANQKNFTPIRWRLIQIIERRFVFDNVDFLTVVQALEGCHREYIGKGRGKNKPLEQRIQELISEFSEVEYIDKFKTSNRQRFKFDAHTIATLRNDSSHCNREEITQISEKGEFCLLFREVRVLLICCILYIIGFQKDTINEILNKCKNDAVNFLG